MQLGAAAGGVEPIMKHFRVESKSAHDATAAAK